MHTYKVLDLPAIPENLLSDARLVSHGLATQIQQNHKTEYHVNEQHQDNNGTIKINRVFKKDNKTFTSRPVPRWNIDTTLENWIRENIINDFIQVGVSNSLPGDDIDSNITVAHSDSNRNFCLQYIIEKSNADQWLVFYQEKGKSLHREPSTFINNYDSVVELDRINIPLNTWVIFDTSILHSVENVSGNRCAIQISLDYNPF
jgi:hypothetical protein